MPQNLNLITWALIPARGGSKGILRKNIKLLGGKPVLQYTAEQAFDSGVCDRIIVSTEDDEIAQKAQAIGLEVPFLRPMELAQDQTPTLDVVSYTLKTLLAEPAAVPPDVIMLLQPTFPFRQASHLRDAIQLMSDNPQADSLISVSPIPHHYSPFYTMSIDEGQVSYLFPGQQYTRRQELKPTFYRNGIIYATRLAILLERRQLEGEHTLPLVIEDEASLINLDTHTDWLAAERILALKHSATNSELVR